MIPNARVKAADCLVPSPRRFLAAAILLLSLAAALAVAEKPAGPAVPRNLDLELLRQAPKMLAFLSDRGHRNVGVLPFEVRKGTRRAGYSSGPLGVTLPGRLENALIMAMGPDEKTALHIIRDAAGAASRQKVGKWSTDAEAFKKLFAATYPLAWGDREVRPDVFLTGTIVNTGDRTTTTVEVEGFTSKAWTGPRVKRFAVARLVVKTDRALLRDLGYSYALPPSVLRRGVKPQERDRQAVALVEKDERGAKPTAKGGLAHSPANVAGMAFAISCDGVKQQVRPLTESREGARAPLFQVDPVSPGAKVALILTRVGDEERRLGVVVKVNGLSTFEMDDRDTLQCRKWLYDRSDRGKPDRIEGFWMDDRGENVLRFKVLTGRESAIRANELGERAGWIDVDVFASGEEPQPEEQMMVSTRGLARGGRRPASLAELQKQLMKRNNVRHRESKVIRKTAGGLIVADPEPAPGAPLSTGKLPNPVRLGGISIKYYDRSSPGAD